MHRLRWAAIPAAVLCAALFVSAASARLASNGIVPVFCGMNGSAVYEIPTGVPLQLRLGWSVKTSGQASKFLDSQLLSWTVTSSSGAVLASRTPTTYGDQTYWSGPVYQEILLGDGTREKVYTSNYLAPTGLTLTVGETVTVSYTLTANAKTDDGFGFAYDKFETISTWNGCTVTGV
jgi:hypothetical protein